MDSEAHKYQCCEIWSGSGKGSVGRDVPMDLRTAVAGSEICKVKIMQVEPCAEKIMEVEPCEAKVTREKVMKEHEIGESCCEE